MNLGANYYPFSRKSLIMSRSSNKSKHNDIILANLQLLYKCEKLNFVEPVNQSEISRLTKTCWACGIER